MQLRKLAASALGSLMAGATLAFPVAAADLEDLPEPFIEGEEAAFSMVVGETAATEDVVGAIDVAVSMGGQPTVEETVETEGAQGDWSAEGGVTLDTRNDDLYFGDSVDDVRETLTESDELDILEDVTFEDDAGDETDITSYLNVGDGEVTYGNSPDGLDDEDPVLHVPVDAEGDVKDDAYLFNLQSNFEDEVDFRSDDVVGEEIELFGQTFTVAQENQDDLEDDDEELILYGSSETLSMEDGDSETFEIDGDEHEIEVAAVNSDGVAYRVDGESIEQKKEDETFNVDGQQIRIDSVVNLEDDAGYADFAIGSEEYTLEDGEPVQDDDDDDIEGTRVKMEGDVSELSSLDLYVGAEDDEEDYLEAGDTFSHDFVPQVEVAFGGLNPDASEEGSEVEVSADGDDDAALDFTPEGEDSASVNFAHQEDGDSTGDLALADDDDNAIQTAEGETLTEDEYFTSDAGDFDHMWQVTNIDRDDDEATVDIEDAITGDDVEIELDRSDDTDDFTDEKIIDGQKYQVQVDDDSDEVEFAWGDEAATTSDDSEDINVGDETSLFTALDTENDAAVALTENYEDPGSGEYVLPSTESTSDVVLDIEDSDYVDVDGSEALNLSSNEDVDDTYAVEAGGLVYALNIDTDGNVDDLALADDQEEDTGETVSRLDGPTAAVIEPEDDDDDENGYAIETTWDNDDEEVDVEEADYPEGHQDADLESDDDITAGYDVFGAYSEYDSEDEGSFTLSIPDGQSVVGAAVTDTDGSLSAESAGGSVEYDKVVPVYHAIGSLDTEITDPSGADDLVLVGGPSVNNLVDDLVQEGKVEGTEVEDEEDTFEWQEDTPEIQLVEDAFAEDQTALIVAGWDADETRDAAASVQEHLDAGTLEGATDAL